MRRENRFRLHASWCYLRCFVSHRSWTPSKIPLFIVQSLLSRFLLVSRKSGRICDVYNPKYAFIGGVSGLGVFSAIAGFMQNKIAIIILRALIGIASALTIPSALTLLVIVFPEPLEQARAIGVFAGCGAVANVIGLLIGAVLVQFGSYHWIFWFVAIVAIPVALGCIFIIPSEIVRTKDELDGCVAKWKNLDLIGVTSLTTALILFIFALTSGSANGWATAGVLTPLIISILLFVGFFYWETLIPAEKAAIPPRTWFYNNFSVLFGAALLPLFWWNAVFTVFTTLWQGVFHWTVISTVIHMIPIGIVAFVMSFAGALSRIFSPKWIILTGLSLLIVAATLIAVSGGLPEDYWPYVFPAFSLGSAGAMLTYTHTNIAIFQAAPANMAGTVGAIFNGAMLCGSAIGLAATSAIETSVEATHGGPEQYYGRAASFWFILGIVVLEIITLSFFYQRKTDHGPQPNFEDQASEEKIQQASEAKNDSTAVTEEVANSPV